MTGPSYLLYIFCILTFDTCLKLFTLKIIDRQLLINELSKLLKDYISSFSKKVIKRGFYASLPAPLPWTECLLRMDCR